MLVVERLETALDAGRRIHAVIEGVGVSPTEHQARQFDQARQGRFWPCAGPGVRLEWIPVTPHSAYTEAHGTGTPVGDTTELTSLVELIGQKKHKVTISTAKGFIGHAMPAAGWQA